MSKLQSVNNETIWLSDVILAALSEYAIKIFAKLADYFCNTLFYLFYNILYALTVLQITHLLVNSSGLC